MLAHLFFVYICFMNDKEFELLKKYMNYIDEIESVTYVDTFDRDAENRMKEKFTEHEKIVLQEISKSLQQ